MSSALCVHSVSNNFQKGYIMRQVYFFTLLALSRDLFIFTGKVKEATTDWPGNVTGAKVQASS